MQSSKDNLLWERFQSLSAKQRIPHALLLIGAQIDFAYKIASAILCSALQKPCGECKSCRLMHLREHPDLNYLTVDKEGGIIKIDQIRELHPLAFTSAQLSNGRVIILHPAERMNTAAANALLKLLEEPPSFLYFLLIAEQISTIPPTVLSRCQQWLFSYADYSGSDYLTLGQKCSFGTEKETIFSQLPDIIDDLTQMINNKLSVWTIADKWLVYNFTHLMWLIYLINAQLIDYQFHSDPDEKEWTKPLAVLAQHFDLVHLFKQLDQINEIMKKLQRNINFNQNLVLENLLLGYL